MNRPKLLFVYDHKYPDMWMDGLYAALNLLEEDFEIEKLNIPVYTPDFANRGPAWFASFDFMLGWGGFNSSADKFVRGSIFPAKKGLCIGGNAYPPTGADNYDVLFYETKWYRPQIAFHKNIVHAFGVNTDIYNKIDISTPVVWDYIGVGAFADWKRWTKMLDKKGRRLVVGEYQEDNPAESGWISEKLIKGGVMVSNMVNPYDLANLYHWSRTLYMPSTEYGGGERAIWEAKACGLSIEIEDDNPKLKELTESEVKDHYWYASQLKKGILSAL